MHLIWNGALLNVLNIAKVVLILPNAIMVFGKMRTDKILRNMSKVGVSFNGVQRKRLGVVVETDAQKRDAAEVTMSSQIEKLNGNIAKPLVTCCGVN
jgi:hypothetical protein